jgi:hypothetical protein
MKILATTIGAALLLAVTAFAQQEHHYAMASNRNSTTQDPETQDPQTNDEEEGKPAVVVGYVRDVACLVQNHKAGAATSKTARECLQDCIRGGSPIVLLGEDGILYTPISPETPDKDVRFNMLPYAGKYVKASGKVYERGGLHAFAIEKIQAIDRPADSKIPEK